jgi:hypothetical protein
MQLIRSQTKLDIVVHIDEQLDEQNRLRVAHAITKAKGVERAHFTSERHHLLVIGYDPASTSSSQILKLVRKQQLHAQLVGGL